MGIYYLDLALKISTFHLWIFSLISYIVAVVMAFLGELFGVLIFTVLCLFLLVLTKWTSF